MSPTSRFTILILFFSAINGIISASNEEMPRLDNPMSVNYLKKNLRKTHPRLVLNSKTEKNLRRKLKTDPVVQNMFNAIKLNAEEIMDQPYLERNLIGRRLLGTSREMLYRINMLGMVYRIEKDPKVL